MLGTLPPLSIHMIFFTANRTKCGKQQAKVHDMRYIQGFRVINMSLTLSLNDCRGNLIRIFHQSPMVDG